VEEIKRQFEKDSVDFVVNVVGEGGGIETLERLHGVIGEMVGRGGLVLSVGRENREGEEELVSWLRLVSRTKKKVKDLTEGRSKPSEQLLRRLKLAVCVGVSCFPSVSRSATTKYQLC